MAAREQRDRGSGDGPFVAAKKWASVPTDRGPTQQEVMFTKTPSPSLSHTHTLSRCLSQVRTREKKVADT